VDNPDETIKAQDWESLVDRFFESKTSMAEFCRQNSLSYDNFRTFKIRLEAKRLRKARKAFAKVEAPAAQPTKPCAQLPDPEWFARFVRCLLDQR
jgi:hypothetical protein